MVSDITDCSLYFFLSQIEKIATQPFLAYAVPVVGIVVVGNWALMGAEDYISIVKHGKRKTAMEERIEDKFLRQGFDFKNCIRKSFLKFG